MSEIRFRGKRIDNKEWVSGVPVKSVNGKIYMITLWDNVGWWEKTPRILYVEVDPETVEQYTGYVDSLGNKIFEGDIIKVGELEWIVVFKNGAFRCEKVENRKKVRNIGYLAVFGLEVIGNIHDNPELLEVRE